MKPCDHSMTPWSHGAGWMKPWNKSSDGAMSLPWMKPWMKSFDEAMDEPLDEAMDETFDDAMDGMNGGYSLALRVLDGRLFLTPQG